MNDYYREKIYLLDMMEENTTATAADEHTTTVGTFSQSQKARLTPEEMKDKLLRATAHWNHDHVEAKLGENAVLLSKWTLLLDRDEKRGGIVSEAEAREHAMVRRQLHESLGFLTKYVQLHLSMKASETSASITSVSASTNAGAGKRPLEDVVVDPQAAGETEQQDDDSQKRAKVEAVAQ